MQFTREGPLLATLRCESGDQTIASAGMQPMRNITEGPGCTWQHSHMCWVGSLDFEWRNHIHPLPILCSS